MSLSYHFLITFAYFPINNSMWDYLLWIILCTFSYYSRVYGFLCHYLIIFRITFAYTIPRLSYVHFLFILCTTFSYKYLYVGLSYSDYLMYILLLLSRIRHLHYLTYIFRIDLILCTLSYNSMWVTTDYLIYIFVLTSSY